MKFLFLSLFSALVVISSCSNESDKTPATTDNGPAQPDYSSNPDYAKGLALVAKSDCLTCHKISEQLVGPSYKDVANKYAATPENITLLATRIITGVPAEKGIWGAAAMTPHPQISQQDAEQMVKYVLLLKK